ncbi:MAG TPA: hypothetical protein VNN25_12110 [Thermoanaerobaculia bacterium]|nr:hypothetical protein [Thermoanaerobaculia bacterium]
MVRLFNGTAIVESNNGLRIHEWGRESLAMSAATASTRVAVISLLLWLLSFIVLAVSLLNEAASAQGVVRVVASTLYVLSFIAMIAAISAAIVFMMCQT